MNAPLILSPAYREFRQNLALLLASNDPRHVKMREEANGGLSKMKLLTPGAVHHDSTLSSLSVQYKNEEYIGLELMPVAPVAKLSDYFYKYDKRSRLAAPNDAIGARGEANEIEDKRTDDTYSCKPYALKNYIDAQTLQNQDAPLNEMIDLVEAINELIDFREEMRIAAILTDTGSFGSGQYTSLSGSDRWDSNDGGNPIKDLQNAIKTVWMGRGATQLVGYCSIDVWNVLSRHPAVLDLFKYNGSSPGLATPDMLARFVGLDRILVGKARKDTANEGQTASYDRIWGKVFGVVRVATRPSIRTAAFGYTMRFGAKKTDQWFDVSKGAEGGYYARVSLTEDHKVIASDTGFLINTPIS